MLADIRLYQLISPSLPIGGYSYSQGLEWAVEARWVEDKESLGEWLEGLLSHSITTLELPLLLRLQQALIDSDPLAFVGWCEFLLASRETSELRSEERQRGAALLKLLPSLNVDIPSDLHPAIASTQLAGLALAAHGWSIDPQKTCSGYTWSWLENIVMAGIKLIPLGQTHGQQLLFDLGSRVPAAVQAASEVCDSYMGSATPALSIASSCHETQYTRLFRS